MRIPFVLVLVAAAALAGEPQTAITRCQTETAQTNVDFADKRLVGCGDGFAENVLWHLDRSDSATGALDESVTRRTTGKGAVVYVCDTGVMRDHDEFTRAEGSNVIGGIDGGDIGPPNRGCPDRVLGPCYESAGELFIFTHGTAVASMVAGRHTGIAPDANIVAVTAVFAEPAPWIAVLDKIIEHAFAPTTPPFRTAIINISGGLLQRPGLDLSPMERKMREMIGGVNERGEPDPNGKRFLFVAAAGNSGPLRGGRLGQCDATGFVIQYPAMIGRTIDGLIAVGGIGRDNELWSGSCFGDRVEVWAPAEQLLVASITGRDHYRGAPGDSGTSYATPYVSGVAARLLELDPSLTPAELEARIKSSPSFVRTPSEKTGEGRVVMVPSADRRRAR